ncbi:hypothetical protein [Nocardioides pantholopis]|uniref:hypothetical protein n=1 Tax=Nocardioides pantholopis TaxID=2483798 RepID=UPI000FDBBE41|nr:hypothetical protein [Nocardioides pantholopis]
MAETRTKASGTTARVRVSLAQAAWALCALCALVLAVGALLVAIEATNESNDLVRFVLDLAGVVDLGVFSRTDGVFDFATPTKDALFNWGLAAIVWLVIGRVLDRLLRP